MTSRDATDEATDAADRDEPRRRPRRRRREDDESVASGSPTSGRTMRDERRAEPAPIATGPSNFSRAQVPWGLDLAAAWAWRLLVIAGAGYVRLLAARASSP